MIRQTLSQKYPWLRCLLFWLLLGLVAEIASALLLEYAVLQEAKGLEAVLGNIAVVSILPAFFGELLICVLLGKTDRLPDLCFRFPPSIFDSAFIFLFGTAFYALCIAIIFGGIPKIIRTYAHLVQSVWKNNTPPPST